MNTDDLVVGTFIFLVLSSIMNYFFAKRKSKYLRITMPISIAIFIYSFSIAYGMSQGVNGQVIGIPMTILAFLLTYFWVKGYKS